MIEKTTRTRLRAIVVKIVLRGGKLKPVGYPSNPKTLGEHIKKMRIDKGLFQREVADILNVEVVNIEHWENARNYPMKKYLPRIIDFLGYIPECCEDISELQNPIFRYRIERGISQKELGVDTGTVIALENDTRKYMHGSTKEKLKGIISL